MNKLYTAISAIFLLLCIAGETYGQQVLVNEAGKKELGSFAAQSHNKFVTSHAKALSLAKKHGWSVKVKTKDGGMISLQGVNSLGFPIYLKTDNNTTAAAT